MCEFNYKWLTHIVERLSLPDESQILEVSCLLSESLKDLFAASGCFRTSFPRNSSSFDRKEDC